MMKERRVNQLPTNPNPYAAPKSQGLPLAPSECYRDGNLLVVPKGHELPHRCVKCNAPAIMDKPRKFAWHSPWWYLLILINVIVYAVVAALVQKSAKIAIGLCEEHRRRRRNYSIAATSIVVVGFGAVVMAIGAEEDGALYGVAGGVALLVGLIVAVIGSRALTAARVTKEEARLKGCCEAFLASLQMR